MKRLGGKNMNNEQIAYKVSINTIIGNVILSIIKLLAGIFGKSMAMISDSVHSISDVLSTFIVMVGIKISNKVNDDEHQYGHERLECVASIILSCMLFITGILIGYQGIESIIQKKEIATPTLFALIMAIVSILIKECMYWYTRKYAKLINSNALMADAWHHRSDALSSIGSLIGIVGSMLGFKLLDSIASIIICIFILKVAIDIFKDSVNKMVDKACSKETIENYKKIIKKIKGVKRIDLIKSRLFGNKIYLDVEISVDGNLKLVDAHNISHKVHDKLESSDKNIKHCMIHVNPYEK